MNEKYFKNIRKNLWKSDKNPELVVLSRVLLSKRVKNDWPGDRMAESNEKAMIAKIIVTPQEFGKTLSPTQDLFWQNKIMEKDLYLNIEYYMKIAEKDAYNAK